MKTRGWIAAAAIALVVSAPYGLAAQEGYLLGNPRMSIVFKGLFEQPNTDGEVLDFATDLLTLEGGDFASFGFGATLNFNITDRFALSIEGNGVGSSTRSEFIDFVEVTDNGELPIEQTTELTRRSFNVSGRFYLLPLGRRVGSFAWVPTQFAPYLGGGVGRTRYRLVQEGDFVDVEDLSIFTDYLQTESTGFTQHAYVGADIGLGPRFFANVEGRWNFGDAPVEGDFIGFDNFDLTGYQLAVGIGVRLGGS